MQVNNLTVGQEVKNYKKLCALLNIAIKGGNGKKLQQKEFDRYFKYEKQGQKYIIKEIYEQAKEKIDKRKEGNNTVFAEDFRNLMIYMLHKNRTESMLMSKGAMYKAMNLVNENYLLARSNIPKLSEIVELPQEAIYEFYDYNGSKLRDTLERNLRHCRSRSLLFYESVVAVAVYDTIVAYNDLNKPIVDYKGELVHKVEVVYREATHEEKQIILRFENEVKEEMGLKDNQEIFLKKKWKQFKQEVENRLKQANTNIKFYYEAYKLTWNNEKIDNEYKLININSSDLKTNLNNNMVESINKSTIKRHEKAKSQFLIEGNQYKIDKILGQKAENYIDNNKCLTSVLISEKAKSLKDKLQEPLNRKKYNQINEDSEQLEWNSAVPF